MIEDYTQEQLIAIVDALDKLLELDKHLLDANPILDYAPFKFNNRLQRDLTWNMMTAETQTEFYRRRDEQ